MFAQALVTFLAATMAVASPTPGSSMHSKRNGTSVASTGTIYPNSYYNYDVGTGAIDCRAPSGKVSKAYNNGGHDITTLLTFEYPAASAGKKCQFRFDLSSGAVATGSRKIDVFTSLKPAPGCTSSWAPGNQRDQPVGRMNVAAGTAGVWEATYGSYLTKPAPCKAPGTVEALEIVGVYDVDYVEWKPYTDGAAIVYSS